MQDRNPFSWILAVSVIAIIMALAFAIMRPAPGHAAATPIQHVVLVMEENKNYTSTVGHMPYLDSLRTKYGQASNYWAVAFPSLPNYIALTSGNVPSNIAGKDCLPTGSCVTSQNNIFNQTSGSWSVWAQSIPSPCARGNTSLYAPRHTAAPYYTDLNATCAAHDVGLPLSPSISSKFTLIAPNLCNDMHNCGLSTGDAWLKSYIPKLMASPSYQDGSTLIEITFDSGSGNCGSSCPSHVETVLVNPQLAAKNVTAKMTHYSLLRLNEELLGLPLLGKAGSAADMRSALGL